MLASSLLMLLTAFQWELLKDVPLETIRVDPTRMAQGLMTGIGFLGAGVIMKEQFSIRGLTTAASVWMTSSIGILIGMGFYFPGLFATFLTLMILSVFGWVERRVPTRRFAKLVVRIRSREVMTSEALRDIIEEFDIKGANPSYLLVDEGRFLEYQLTIFSHYTKNFQRLAESLSAMETITEFSIIPTGD
jgi:putative Mg2+ transporter-C (MgtC) family protein